MTLDEATRLIIFEGLDPEGLVTSARMGNDPAPDRLESLGQALDTCTEGLEGATILNRQFAYALFALAQLAEIVQGWTNQGKQWDESFTDEALPMILESVESLFSGDEY